jgi:hypothetical protein
MLTSLLLGFLVAGHAVALARIEYRLRQRDITVPIAAQRFPEAYVEGRAEGLRERRRWMRVMFVGWTAVAALRWLLH